MNATFEITSLRGKVFKVTRDYIIEPNEPTARKIYRKDLAAFFNKDCTGHVSIHYVGLSDVVDMYTGKGKGYVNIGCQSFNLNTVERIKEWALRKTKAKKAGRK